MLRCISLPGSGVRELGHAEKYYSLIHPEAMQYQFNVERYKCLQSKERSERKVINRGQEAKLLRAESSLQLVLMPAVLTRYLVAARR